MIAVEYRLLVKHYCNYYSTAFKQNHKIKLLPCSGMSVTVIKLEADIEEDSLVNEFLAVSQLYGDEQ